MNARLERIAPPICALHGVTLGDVLTTSKRGPIMAAKRAVCLALAADGMHPLQIGKALNRDRTTVLHHLGLHNKRSRK